MTIQLVQPGDRRAVGLLQTVEWKAIKRVANRQTSANPRLEMYWRGVVMIIIRPPAVSAELVEFANRVRVDTTGVERVEDWYTVGREGNRTSKRAVRAEIGAAAITGLRGMRQAFSL